jgi:hypothetical protein
MQTHGGGKKLAATIQTCFHWKTLISDCHEFSRACILCSVMKHSNKGRGEFGVPHMALYPRHSWMIDVVFGLPSVGGYSSYLTMVDVFSGYVTCTALRN